MRKREKFYTSHSYRKRIGPDQSDSRCVFCISLPVRCLHIRACVHFQGVQASCRSGQSPRITLQQRLICDAFAREVTSCEYLSFSLCCSHLPPQTHKQKCYKCRVRALAGMAQWIDCWLANQRVTSSIPNQSTNLGCGPGLQQGAHKRQPHNDVRLPLFLPSPLKISK